MASYRQERQFGLILACIITAIGAWPLLNAEAVGGAWLIAAAIIALISFAVPVVLSPVLKAWLAFSHVLGIINTHILLALTFFLLVTPLALIFKLIGRDPLKLRGGAAQSQWTAREEQSIRSFKDQF